jgi:hypothetical protein
MTLPSLKDPSKYPGCKDLIEEFTYCIHNVSFIDRARGVCELLKPKLKECIDREVKKIVLVELV